LANEGRERVIQPIDTVFRAYSVYSDAGVVTGVIADVE